MMSPRAIGATARAAATGATARAAATSAPRLCLSKVTSCASSKVLDSIPTPSRTKDAAGPGSSSARAPFSTLRRGSTSEEVGPNSFDLVKSLGRGAFGEVFHVKHKRTGKSFAMKVQQKGKILSNNLLRYAQTERNILAYIRHPYIVSLHYAFQTPSHLVLVLQLCPGGNLQQLIKKLGFGGFDERLAQLYTAEILLALIHLHDRNVVFRDLKPDNVVLDDEDHAKLTDFGLSKEGVLGHQGTKTFCGSVAFIAPEILMGKMHGHTVDIYNLGVLLYNMLMGIPPFFHPEKETLHSNIKRARLEIPTCISSSARSLIAATMAKDPSKRLGVARTTDLQEHPFFASMDFVALMRREVPVPEPLAPQPWLKQPEEGHRRPSEPVPKSPFRRQKGWVPRGFRTPRLRVGDAGVRGWEFEAPLSPSKDSVSSQSTAAGTGEWSSTSRDSR